MKTKGFMCITHKVVSTLQLPFYFKLSHKIVCIRTLEFSHICSIKKSSITILRCTRIAPQPYDDDDNNNNDDDDDDDDDDDNDDSDKNRGIIVVGR